MHVQAHRHIKYLYTVSIMFALTVDDEVPTDTTSRDDAYKFDASY